MYIGALLLALLVVAISRYSLEIAHIISHGEIPDHTIAGHTHHHHHDHDHHDHHDHHHGHKHGHHDTHSHDHHHAQSHTHDFLKSDKKDVNSDFQPCPNHKTTNTAIAIDVFCPNDKANLYWIVIGDSSHERSMYRKAFWSYLYERSLIDPPEMA